MKGIFKDASRRFDEHFVRLVSGSPVQTRAGGSGLGCVKQRTCVHAYLSLVHRALAEERNFHTCTVHSSLLFARRIDGLLPDAA